MKSQSRWRTVERVLSIGLACLACLSCIGHAAAQTAPQAWSMRQRDSPASELLDVNPTMLWVGSGLFLGAFVPSLVYAKSDAYNSETALKYPVIGPWLDLAADRCSVDPCNPGQVNGALLMLDGIAQAVGLATLVTGLFVGPKLLSRWFAEQPLVIAPTRLAPYAYGVSTGGRF